MFLFTGITLFMKPVVHLASVIHLQGKLTDGTVFDSSYERGDPIEFELGTGQVIKGNSNGPNQ